MAEVITWRQMAGPNFSGTAAAMDAAGDRLKQGTDLLTQFAGDQTKLFQQQKAKLKADNTARALAELSSFKTIDELNAAAPNLTFDALRGKYGEDIDAGAVAQQAVAQKGIIEQNNLRSIDLANKTRTAQEAPIMGQYREAIQAALNKGDVAGAKSIYAEAATKLTDASDLSNPITEHEVAKFEKGLRQTEANQQTTLFNQAQADRKFKLNYQEQLVKEFEDVNLGKKKEMSFVPPPGVPLSEAYNQFTQASAAAVERADLNPEVKNSLLMQKNYHTGLISRAEDTIKFIKEKNRETKPITHPAVAAFYDGLAPNQRAAINSVTTPSGVITDYLNKNKVESETWEDFRDIGANKVIKEIQDKLGDQKLDDLPATAIAAAMDGVIKNNDNKLNSGDIDVIVRRIKDYTEKDTVYKKNANDEQVSDQANNKILRDFTSKLNKLENIRFNEEKTKRKNEVAISYSDLTGKKPTLKPVDDTNNGESEDVGVLKSDIANLAKELGIYDDKLSRYLESNGQPF